jgi:hypothetical protein
MLAKFLVCLPGFSVLSVRQEFVQRLWFFRSRSEWSVFICRRLIFCPGGRDFSLPAQARWILSPVRVLGQFWCRSQIVAHRLSSTGFHFFVD